MITGGQRMNVLRFGVFLIVAGVGLLVGAWYVHLHGGERVSAMYNDRGGYTIEYLRQEQAKQQLIERLMWGGGIVLVLGIGVAVSANKRPLNDPAK
jgi:hypothetical protein